MHQCYHISLLNKRGKEFELLPCCRHIRQGDCFHCFSVILVIYKDLAK